MNGTIRRAHVNVAAIGVLLSQGCASDKSAATAPDPTPTTPSIPSFSTPTTRLAARIGDVYANLPILDSVHVAAATTVTLRMRVIGNVEVALIKRDQKIAFANGQPYQAIVLFSAESGGARSAEVAPGDYWIALRNHDFAGNAFVYELDRALSLDPEGGHSFTFADTVASWTGWFQTAGRLVFKFSVRSGYRYFVHAIDGGGTLMVLKAEEGEKFYAGGVPFESISAYRSTDGLPGLWELRLAPGDYDLAYQTVGFSDPGLSYVIESWRIQ